MVFLFLLFFPYIFFPKVEHRDEDAERKSLKEKDHKFTPKASIASNFDVDHGPGGSRTIRPLPIRLLHSSGCY